MCCVDGNEIWRQEKVAAAAPDDDDDDGCSAQHSEKRKHRVCYVYNSRIGSYHYGTGHPMKPHRMLLTDALLRSYGVLEHMDHLIPEPADSLAISAYHADDYVAFLRSVNGGAISPEAEALLPPTERNFSYRLLERYNMGDDCPIFEGVWEFCQLYAGGSISAARSLVAGHTECAVHWAGGLHHGKAGEASGFCYVNDCVLAILELLRQYQRVLYVDIDVHHGDGVEEAFYTSDRVLTVSLHKRGGDFFPCTGSLADIGAENGTGFSVNTPLRDGVVDTQYEMLIERLMDLVFQYFRPDVAVLQSGGDSLSGDKLGCFNLTLEGHAAAVKALRKRDIPLLVLGGGGYTLRNVPKAWANETAVVAGVNLPREIPEATDYSYYYWPESKLEVRSNNMCNFNDDAGLAKTLATIAENFRNFVRPSATQCSVSNERDSFTDPLASPFSLVGPPQRPP